MTPPETLTEEEREWLQRFRHYPWPDVSKSSADAGLDAGHVLAKLLRIHDALQARVKGLEGRLSEVDGLACTWQNLDPEGGYSAIRVALGTECELCGGDNPHGHSCTVG